MAILGLTLGVRAQVPAQPPAPAALALSPRTASVTAARQSELVGQYCATCHSDRGRAGGLSLAGWTPARVEETPEVAEKMIRKLRAGMMPPAGAKRPDPTTLDQFAAALETLADLRAAADPNPGWRPLQRLNRAEYARVVKDLLGLDVDITAFLPPDTVSGGFDNIGDVQTFSPALMEGYLRAASRIAGLAVGDPASSPTQATYKLTKTHSQLARAEGAPFGTRGGISVEHTFPADGDYVFGMDFFAEPLGLLFGSTAPDERIEVSVDGARVALLEIDPRMSEEKAGLTLKTPPTRVTAGTHRVTAAFLQRFEGLVNDLIAPIDHTLADTEIGIAFGITTLPHLRSLSVVGPHRTTGVSDGPSRRRIFSCRPTRAAEESACASAIVRRLATAAFRRPVAEQDFERLMSFFTRGRAQRDFEHGITKALEAILASPQFVFHVEEQSAPLTPGSYRLGDYELASRLSFFLWASAPDAELLGRAERGRLSLPGALASETLRMMQDPRAEALATRFASQWLRLQDVDRVVWDPIEFPYADATLSRAFRRETELFFESLVREDRSILDLLTADYTFVNERLARHYGVPNITGNEFRRVPVAEHRRGILGQGSVLTLTSLADRTSPVMRGKWVMEVLLGTPPPPPPPNVPALEETPGTAAGRALTVRERMEEHRRNPACASCHRVIDPLGLALENFDATGRWRAKDGGTPVDSTAELFDGSTISGPGGLRAAVLRHKDAFLVTFTESLMTYALGRRLEPYDMPTVRRIIREAAKHDYRISAFLTGIARSRAFWSTRPPADTLTAAVKPR
jgi:mono/diheme cytochrome c family protein